MLPVNRIKDDMITKNDRIELLALYQYLTEVPNDHAGILLKGGINVPGIVFEPDEFLGDFPVLNKMKNTFPFLENKCSFIVTDTNINEFTPHSDDSHASILTVLESDGITETTWYTIEQAPAFDFSHRLYGVIPHDRTLLNTRHRECLEQDVTYLFDSHTFHSVRNTTKNRRIVFTWWLEHIAYHPAYEYYKQHGYI